MRRLLSLLVACALLVAAPWALAATPPEIGASISTRQAEVGEPFQISIEALVDDGRSPRGPKLRLPRGLNATRPSISSKTMATFGSGGAMIRTGIRATWMITAEKTGNFVIPPPSIEVGGRRYKADRALKIRITKASGKTRRKPRGGTFPFNIGGGLMPDEPADEPELLSDKGRALSLPKEPEKFLFIRAVSDRDEVVVGEQVTVAYYLYYRVSWSSDDRRLPPYPDFLRVPIEGDPGASATRITSVGRWRYHVRLIDKVALFPLRAGKLETGQMRASFTGRRLGSREERRSNNLTITVREPPKDGRPAGYRLGDVGRYRLSATVEPKKIEQGGSVSVRVKVGGVGYIPTSLDVPARTGVEWLAPEKREEIGVERGKIKGWRSFGYVVRLHEAGTVDLGEVALPYYDPRKKSYDTARVKLGYVEVTPSGKKGDAGAPPPSAADDDRFATIGTPRMALSDYTPRDDGGMEPSRLWTLVIAPPLAVLAFGGLGTMLGALRRRREEQQQDAGNLADKAVRDMKQASDPKEAAAIAERALHFAIEAATGIKSRGVLMSELPDRLRDADVPDELVADLESALTTCSDLRFDPSPSDDQAVDLRSRIRPLVKALAKVRKAREAA